MDNFNKNLISNIQGGVIICEYDPLLCKSKTVYLSEGWTELTGYTLEDLNEFFDGNPQAIIIPDDRQYADMKYFEQTQIGNSYQLEYRIRHKDGSIRWAIDRGIIVLSDNGHNQNQSILTDITPIKENEEKFRISEARLRVASRASGATIFEFDIEANMYLYIENTDDIFGIGEDFIICNVQKERETVKIFTFEALLSLWYHPDDIDLVIKTKNDMLQNKTSECETRVRRYDGTYIWCKLNLALVEDVSGKENRIIGHMLNINEHHKQTERLLCEAQSDALTGLYNKTAIRTLIEQSLVNQNNMKILLMLDIDNFKSVNDTMGHLFGDAVLIGVSNKIKKLFPNRGLLGRIGGDEFVILLQGDFSQSEIVSRAEGVCEAFRQTYSGEKLDYKISCSVGIAVAECGDTYYSLFRKADIALYQAKAKGKDRYVIYSIDVNVNECPLIPVIDEVVVSDSGNLKIKERIFELLYDSVDLSMSVNMILELLGEMLNASRCYIFENTLDNKFSHNIYEWHDEGIEEAMKCIAIDELDYFSQFNEGGICYQRDVKLLSLSPSLNELYKNSKIVSTFQVAIIEDGVIQGFMGYDFFERPLNQTSEQIDIMTFAAKITGTFIIKKRADESVKMYNRNKMEALDNLPSGIYVIDEKYNVQYINNFVLSVFPDVKIGQKCYEIFMKNESPCTNCPAISCGSETCSTEIYNQHSKMWMIANASTIRWSGYDNMRLISCQVINQYKE